MPANPAPSGAALSRSVLAAIALRAVTDVPWTAATEVADHLGADLVEVRAAVRAHLEAGRLYPPDGLVVLRIEALGDVAPLDATPARPSAEARRHAVDLAVYGELAMLAARGRVAHHQAALTSGAHLSVDTWERVLRRLRDTRRPGGALVGPARCLVPTQDGWRWLADGPGS